VAPNGCTVRVARQRAAHAARAACLTGRWAIATLGVSARWRGVCDMQQVAQRAGTVERWTKRTTSGMPDDRAAGVSSASAGSGLPTRELGPAPMVARVRRDLPRRGQAPSAIVRRTQRHRVRRWLGGKADRRCLPRCERIRGRCVIGLPPGIARCARRSG
jgi:hypothetical protein